MNSLGRVRTREQQIPAPFVAVLERAAAHFFVTVPEVLGKERHQSVLRARRYAMAALHEAPFRRSYSEIARIFNQRDHTGPMGACRKVARELAAGDVVAIEAMGAIREQRISDAAE